VHAVFAPVGFVVDADMTMAMPPRPSWFIATGITEIAGRFCIARRDEAGATAADGTAAPRTATTPLRPDPPIESPGSN
jgi:hypothetical protein